MPAETDDADGTDEVAIDADDTAWEAVAESRAVPPARRGGRDARRETTLRALAAGQEAHCAYCGQVLPPIPPRGGRPTPYCPPDPDRYGQWGAKVITCAMLDEHREIWVRVYGPDQPMTQVDVLQLDERTATLLTAVEPLRDEIRALRTRVIEETAAALAAQDAADEARDHAQERARTAEAERTRALTEAERARRQAEEDREQRRAAQDAAAQAQEEKKQAIAERDTARETKATAEDDRQRALQQVTAAQDRVTELQSTLDGERATALEKLDRLRRDGDEARQRLRTALAEDYDRRLGARAGEFTEQIRAVRTAADERITELTNQLTEATRTYSEALGPLHDQLDALRGDLAQRTAHAAALREQLGAVRTTLHEALGQTTDSDPLRQHLTAALHLADHKPPTGTPPALPTQA